jgi:hypothetical protein
MSDDLEAMIAASDLCLCGCGPEPHRVGSSMKGDTACNDCGGDVCGWYRRVGDYE